MQCIFYRAFSLARVIQFSVGRLGERVWVPYGFGGVLLEWSDELFMFDLCCDEMRNLCVVVYLYIIYCDVRC